MIFLSSTEPVVAYGVLALHDPFEALLGTHLPRMIKTTLLPFKGSIVYDSLMTSYNITFGAGIRRRLNDSYKVAKAAFGVVTSLPMQEPQPLPQLAKKTRAATARETQDRTKGASSSMTATEAAHRALEAIIGLISSFCQNHLDDEYEALCWKMARVLARKRPSPLLQGKPNSWACGIVRAIGWVNFLGDPSQPHHMKMTDIDAAFGVSEATGSAKAKTIRVLLKVYAFDPEWTVPSRMEENPMAWMIEINGFIADARHLDRKTQEEAYRRGLIPYIPRERPGKEEDPRR
jgi:hypothetical protein